MLLVETDLDSLHDNLREIQSLLVDILDFHGLRLSTTFLLMEITQVVADLLRLGNCQLIDGLGHVELRVVVGDNL